MKISKRNKTSFQNRRKIRIIRENDDQVAQKLHKTSEERRSKSRDDKSRDNR